MYLAAMARISWRRHSHCSLVVTFVPSKNVNGSGSFLFTGRLLASGKLGRVHLTLEPPPALLVLAPPVAPPVLVVAPPVLVVAPPVLAVAPPVLADLPPELDVVPPVLADLPPELAVVPPELAVVPPELAAVPPELAAVPPELAAVPPELDAVPPELDVVPPFASVPPMAGELPPPPVTVPVAPVHAPREGIDAKDRREAARSLLLLVMGITVTGGEPIRVMGETCDCTPRASPYTSTIGSYSRLVASRS
jgi:hypothetical protein